VTVADRRKISFSETHARLLAILIIALCAACSFFAVATFYLLKTRSNVKIEIVELAPPKVETPEFEETVKLTEIPLSTPTEYLIEEFDYQKIIVGATEVVEKGTQVSVYTVDGESALKIINSSGTDYVFGKLNDDLYTVALIGDYAAPGMIPSRSLYGVFVFSLTDREYAFEKLLAMRAAGYPSYLMHFIKDARDWYSLVLGAFTDIDSAEDFNSTLDWKKVMQVASVSRPGFVGRISP